MAEDLEPLFEFVARALHTANPASLVQPLEVAEISARWAPYARVRGALGIATNEDYELLLMRLLSGEGGYVFADESLQDDLKREVESTNPDLTALRTYGAARITLAREPMCRVLGIAIEQLPASPDSRKGRIASPPTSPVGDPNKTIPGARVAQAPSCQFCGHSLPAGRTVNFCPNCGLNVTKRRCPGCSSEVQPGWRFCVACGRAIGSTR
jgi:hypothetical protein